MVCHLLIVCCMCVAHLPVPRLLLVSRVRRASSRHSTAQPRAFSALLARCRKLFPVLSLFAININLCPMLHDTSRCAFSLCRFSRRLARASAATATRARLPMLRYVCCLMLLFVDCCVLMWFVFQGRSQCTPCGVGKQRVFLVYNSHCFFAGNYVNVTGTP